METIIEKGTKLDIFEDDLSKEAFNDFSNSKLIGMDIETNGLKFRESNINLIQLYSKNKNPCIIKINNKIPKYIVSLIENKEITKIFHFALFDLPFMSYHWKAIPNNIVCTKICSKLIHTEEGFKHSLKPLLAKYLSIEIDKTMRLSNWSSNHLSEEQLEYAVNDVVYLADLYQTLKTELEKRHIFSLALDCFKHIPTRVKLEVMGYPDVFLY